MALFVFYNCSMSAPILATTLYIPPPRPTSVSRPHLIKRLNEGLHRRLTLLSAPAGSEALVAIRTKIRELVDEVLEGEESETRPDAVAHPKHTQGPKGERTP